MLTPVPLPDFRDSARALMHDLPRLRAAINEAKVLLSALRGECTCPAPDPKHCRCVQRWRAHSACRMWEGAEAGLYLLREEYRAVYAEATGDVWGEDAHGLVLVGPLDGERTTHVLSGNRWVPSAILPAWWGDEAVHSSHRAVLLGKWHEDCLKAESEPRRQAAKRSIFSAWDNAWPEKPARRLPNGSWPYAWPLLCNRCLVEGTVLAEQPTGFSPISCPACAGKGYILRIGPGGFLSEEEETMNSDANPKIEYRTGLPTIEQIRAHEARGGWWMSHDPSNGHLVSDYNELDVAKLRVRDHVVQQLRFVDGKAIWRRSVCGEERLYRPVLLDGTPCPWPETEK